MSVRERSKGSMAITAWVLSEVTRLARHARSTKKIAFDLLAMRRVVTGLGGTISPEARRRALAIIDEALKDVGYDEAPKRMSIDMLPRRYRLMLERLRKEEERIFPMAI